MRIKVKGGELAGRNRRRQFLTSRLVLCIYVLVCRIRHINSQKCVIVALPSSSPPPGTIELKEMVEIIGTLYEMEGVNSDTAGQNLVGLAL